MEADVQKQANSEGTPTPPPKITATGLPCLKNKPQKEGGNKTPRRQRIQGKPLEPPHN